MAATAEDVQEWIERAKSENERIKKAHPKRKKHRLVTHIVSVCDQFDHDDYPVYVYTDQNADYVKAAYNKKPMQKVNEVIKID